MENIINQAWENRDQINTATKGDVRDAVTEALNALDSGKARIAEKIDGTWHVHQWLKKAVLLSFRLNDMSAISGGPHGSTWWDKVPSKFKGWDEDAFKAAGFRAVPHAIVRHSAYIAKGVV
ncbi:MAG TPA: 2,3,4,5-tetrahydropyridine-2,6-dicarboxylate N-succinyltransferase, partial [Alphaproteobacteria bacterium]|nr:2,3,4,5-tetrahydropyridine-2,6-dicarboxylate N-succinyltransferase [Alphaproteobacteria bacterium]